MLRDRIDSLIKESMLSKDSVRTEALRMIKAKLLVAEKSGAAYDDAMELKTLLKLKASIEDSIAQFKAAGRDDLVENEANGLKVLNEFLPKEASEDDIKTMANEVIDSLDHPVSMKDMKAILTAVQAKYPTANGKVVSEVVKSRM